MAEQQLQDYLENGIKNIVADALRASLQNPAASLYLASFIRNARKAAAQRLEYENSGEHIPPFLIASITSSCNLHCAGCYARSNHSCHDGRAAEQLTADQWDRIFSEAEQLGISFILLAGGEPLVRKDVIERAARHKKIIFPVFSNGTLIDAEFAAFAAANRNLIPVLSLEGEAAETDARRGSGVYQQLEQAMAELQQRSVLFGASLTVTRHNLTEILADSFVGQAQAKGCKVFFYVEYVPVGGSEQLAPGAAERNYLLQRLADLRRSYPKMMFIAFPGDEEASGGCLAAGRGFFHINSHGGAEPCPFSPYSDTNLLQTSLRQALRSPLFGELRSGACLEGEHNGGCVLYEQEAKVRELVSRENEKQ